MPTRNGWSVAAATVVLLAAAFLLGYPELAVFGFASLAALLVAGAWMLARPRLAVQREIRPMRVTAGESAAAILTVTNETGRRCPPIIAKDSVDGSAVRVPVPSLAARDTHRTGYPLPARRRGIYPVGPLTVEHTDPLRLMAMPKRYSAASTLYVHPVVDPVRPLPTGESHDQDGATSSRAPQGGIAFHSLREYVHGDDRRLVHWRSSARTGRLMVRHHTIPNEPRILVVLDTSAAAYADGESFESAVRAAASLCAAALGGGFPLRLCTTAGEAMNAGEGGHERTAVLDLLAAVRRDVADPGLAVLPSLVPDEGAVSLGVVTGVPGPAMLGMIPRVRSRVRTASLVQFVRGAGEPARLPGVTVLPARGPAEFAAAWNELVSP
ncbi:uncharacterized protein (DUF58 family) [Catenuloplanes nepalensis]|uniref:Uncharacterized protein (DUF58 family) n=1 Tax=Catenuloplanes nepalensis TaxID=587533 RepID=A0ABT9MS26_9ACTN|nr:DUF58 domain-containing protein [Catenuloplanes nepalensis]MDP9794240.1 uncharacterized protein (DUF58 family) [Catenuloplanes nepalensis]